MLDFYMGLFDGMRDFIGSGRIPYVAGFLAVLNLSFLAFASFRKRKEGIVGLYACCNATDIVMYTLLGAKSGFISAVMSFLRNVAFAKFGSALFTCVFCAMKVLLLAQGGEGIFTAMFIIMCVAETVAILLFSPLCVKAVAVIQQALWVCYDVSYSGVFVALCTSIGLVSLLAGAIEEFTRTRKHKETEPVGDGCLCPNKHVDGKSAAD